MVGSRIRNEKVAACGWGLKVAVDTLTMNIFIRQNIGRGITFKILISRTVQDRFRPNLAEILENDQSALGLFYIKWCFRAIQKQLKLNLLKT